MHKNFIQSKLQAEVNHHSSVLWSLKAAAAKRDGEEVVVFVEMCQAECLVFQLQLKLQEKQLKSLSTVTTIDVISKRKLDSLTVNLSFLCHFGFLCYKASQTSLAA